MKERYGVTSALKSNLFLEKMQSTMQSRHGVMVPSQIKHYRKKSQETSLARYGAAHHTKSDQWKEKYSSLFREKHGVDWPFQSSSIKDKAFITMIERYGNKHALQNDDIMQKMSQTMMDRHGMDFYTRSDDVKSGNKERIRQRYIEAYSKLEDRQWLHEHHITKKLSVYRIAKQLNCSGSLVLRFLDTHKIERKFWKSYGEQEISAFLQDLSIDHRTRCRKTIDNMELDIVIPSHNIAIEFNGLYWHSFDRLENQEERLYHSHKTQLCKEKDIQLFHIFENEWQDKQLVWKDMIRHRLGLSETRVYARQCTIEKLSSQESQTFLNNNHLQGYRSAKVTLGLFYNDDLIAVMSFSKPRFSGKHQWELLRFCSRNGTVIAGGASKLFKHFVRNYEPTSVISYSNRRHSQGNLYSNLGFEHSHVSPPSYVYWKKDVILSRYQTQKHLLSSVLEDFDVSLSEAENMFRNGYRRLWDCGTDVYQWVS